MTGWLRSANEGASIASGPGFTPPPRRRRAGLAASVERAFALLLISAPLLVGGGPAWSQLVVSAAAFAVLVALMVSRRGDLRWEPFATPAAAAVLFTAVQLVPLPRRVVGALSQQALQIRSSALDTEPAFLPLTLDVPATLLALANSLTLLAVVLVAGSVARRSSRMRRLAVALVAVGVLVALVDLTQKALGLREILGLYRPESAPGAGGPSGTFVNANHAASLYGLAALVGVGLALSSAGGRCFAAAAAAALCGTMVFLTGSRAGAATFLLGGMLLAVLGATDFRDRRRSLAYAALGTAGLLCAALVFAERAWQRVQEAGLAGLLHNQKTRGWAAAARLTQDFPWTGVGRGAFEAPATAYRTSSEAVRLAYPENGLLQIASEWGLLAAAAFLIVLLLPLSRLLGLLPRLEPLPRAAICGFLAVLAHELADFGMELPGVAVPAIAALMIGSAGAERSKLSEERRRAPLAAYLTLGAWPLVLAGGLWALPRTLTSEGARLHEALRTGQPGLAGEIRSAIGRHPADYYLQLLAAAEAAQRGDRTGPAHINRALQLYPSDGQAHRMAARWLARAGHRSQAALEYRLAASLGTQVSLEELLQTLGAMHVAEAVPQNGASLMTLARTFLAKGDKAQARLVSRRALDVAGPDEPLVRERLALALQSEAADFISEAAGDLLGTAKSLDAFVAAAEALSKVARWPEAERTLAMARERYPDSPALLRASARLQLDRGDLERADATLRAATAAPHISLTERIAIEQMRVTVAEKRGDPDAALAATIRLRHLQRLDAKRAPHGAP
jgi:O-antigen ligase